MVRWDEQHRLGLEHAAYVCWCVHAIRSDSLARHCCRAALQEDDARWFFQQLIVGLDYCHKMVRIWLHAPLLVLFA